MTLVSHCQTRIIWYSNNFFYSAYLPNTDLDAVDGGAINIAADHQMFVTLTGQLS